MRRHHNSPRPPGASTDRTTAAKWNGAVGQVLAYSQARPTDRLVLVAIAQHTGRTGMAHPGIPRLAELAGMSERSIKRALVRLEEAGELVVVRRNGAANRYVPVVAEPVPEPSTKATLNQGHFNPQPGPNEASTQATQVAPGRVTRERVGAHASPPGARPFGPPGLEEEGDDPGPVLTVEELRAQLRRGSRWRA